MSKLTKEEKAFATIVARKIANELKKDEENIKETNYTLKEIESIFFDVTLENDAIDLVKTFDFTEMIKASTAYNELRKVWPNDILESFLLEDEKLNSKAIKKFLLASNKKVEKICEKTEKLTRVLSYTFEDWTRIVLLSNFDLVYKRIIDIRNVTQSSPLCWSKDIDALIKSTEGDFEIYLFRLSLIYKNFNWLWIYFLPIITRQDFSVIHRNFCEAKSVPFIQEFDVKDLISICSHSDFDNYVYRACKISEQIKNKERFDNWFKSEGQKKYGGYYNLIIYDYERIGDVFLSYEAYLIEKEKEYIKKEKEKSIRAGRYHSMKFDNFCIGNCSICNRTEDCPMEKRNK